MQGVSEPKDNDRRSRAHESLSLQDAVNDRLGDFAGHQAGRQERRRRALETDKHRRLHVRGADDRGADLWRLVDVQNLGGEAFVERESGSLGGAVCRINTVRRYDGNIRNGCTHTPRCRELVRKPRQKRASATRGDVSTQRLRQRRIGDVRQRGRDCVSAFRAEKPEQYRSEP